MCSVTISLWNGRFGNNIQQLAIASHFAFVEHRAHVLAFPPRPWLLAEQVSNPDPAACRCDRPLTWFCDQRQRDNVFFRRRTSHKPDISIFEKKQCLQRYVRTIVSPELYESRGPAADLAVHVRSGDVAETSSGPYRVQPDGYYQQVIDRALERGEDVRVVFEDDRVATVGSLKRRYGTVAGVAFQSSTMAADFRTLVNAGALACSVGTFSISAYQLSRSIRTVYLSRTRIPPLHLDDDPETELVII